MNFLILLNHVLVVVSLGLAFPTLSVPPFHPATAPAPMSWGRKHEYGDGV